MLDTNVIISAIRSARGASNVVVDLAGEHNGFFQPVLTGPLVNEYEDVIYRPEHRMNWQDSELYELIQTLLVPAHWTDTNFSYRPLLDDAGDELVLEAAINGQAKYIVTFNAKHFPPETLATYGIRAVKPGEFLKILLEKGLVYGKE